MNGKNRSIKTRRKKIFTKGELNRAVDAVFHPLCKVDKRFLLLDGFLHGLVERDPPETVRKFLRYNLAEIIKEVSEKK
jgi:hypothetical protein